MGLAAAPAGSAVDSRNRPDLAGGGLIALVPLMVAGFAARVVARVWRGEADFLQHGYSFYIPLVETWLAGHGLCTGPGQHCALRMPVYPLFIAPFVATADLYPGVALVQAAIGAAMAWPAWWLARRWFGERAGLVAAALTAFSPYAVIHDTALQDTVLVNGLALLGLWLLVVGSWPGRGSLWALAGGGAAFALATLTTARVAFVLPAAAAWIAAISLGRQDAWRRIVAVTAPMGLLVGFWLFRSVLVVGAPVLTTESGIGLWKANSPHTMEYFPRMSMDRMTVAAESTLSHEQRAELSAAGADEVARDRIRARWALSYMAARPWDTVGRMLRKVAVVAGAELSPARGPLVQVGYAAVYGTLQLLAVVGLWKARRDWREQSLVWLVLLGFLAITAVFWAHTSHRSVVDAVVFVYAAGAVSWLQKIRGRPGRQSHFLRPRKTRPA